jgi:hemolysin III
MRDKHSFAQLPIDEKWNVATHGFGLLLSLIGIPVLLWFGNYLYSSSNELVGVSIFSLGLVMVYSSSTGYHYVTGSVKYNWRIFDHISIYFLIGGTYAAYILKYLDLSLGLKFLSVQWSIILACIIFKIFYTGKFDLLSTLLYVVIGLMVLGIAEPLVESVPYEVIIWLIAGGLSYIIGVGFYLMETYKFSHPIWHLFVLGGSTCHFIGLFY